MSCALHNIKWGSHRLGTKLRIVSKTTTTIIIIFVVGGRLVDKEGALHVKMSVEKNTKANEKQVHNFRFAEPGKGA